MFHFPSPISHAQRCVRARTRTIYFQLPDIPDWAERKTTIEKKRRAVGEPLSCKERMNSQLGNLISWSVSMEWPKKKKEEKGLEEKLSLAPSLFSSFCRTIEKRHFISCSISLVSRSLMWLEASWRDRVEEQGSIQSSFTRSLTQGENGFT